MNRVKVYVIRNTAKIAGTVLFLTFAGEYFHNENKDEQYYDLPLGVPTTNKYHEDTPIPVITRTTEITTVTTSGAPSDQGSYTVRIP